MGSGSSVTPIRKGGSDTTADELEAAFSEEVKDNSLCVVGTLIKEHEAGQVIAAKINDKITYPATTISRVLKRFGITVSTEVIGKHRKGTCRCLPEEVQP